MDRVGPSCGQNPPPLPAVPAMPTRDPFAKRTTVAQPSSTSMPRAFEHAPERYPAQRSQVVVAKHRDDGQSSGRQELASHLSFQQAPVLREIPSDKQEVGIVREAGKTGDRTQVFSTTDVEIANRRDANLQEL